MKVVTVEEQTDADKTASVQEREHAVLSDGVKVTPVVPKMATAELMKPEIDQDLTDAQTAKNALARGDAVSLDGAMVILSVDDN